MERRDKIDQEYSLHGEYLQPAGYIMKGCLYCSEHPMYLSPELVRMEREYLD